MTDTPDILKKILYRKVEEITERSQKCSLKQLSHQAEAAPPPRGFLQAIQGCRHMDRPAVIAEIKQASPSKGLLRTPFYPIEIAESYEAHDATCLSVLTDKDFFQGSEQYLQQVREASNLPILRKDFIIDAYQVYEARMLGADCILLIVAALGDALLNDLTGLALFLGMDVLIEVHDEKELERALALKVPLIGINNRNLHTFETNLDTTLRLLKHIPPQYEVVTESGIHTRADVDLMLQAGVNAFLVGEAFMYAADPGEALSTLFRD